MKSLNKSGVLLALAGLSSALGCSGDATTSGRDGVGDGTAGAGANPAAGNGVNADGSPLGSDSCVQQDAVATLRYRPVDIIFIIDNSGSMGKEIEGVQTSINDNFASIIDASGIDYRVIMVTRHGKLGDENVCIDGVLSPGADCQSVGNDTPPVMNAPVFFHYDIGVGSTDSWCRLLEAYDSPDRHNLAPDGLRHWLREDAFQVFVEITDDRVNCNDGPNRTDFNDRNDAASAMNAALLFDSALLSLDGGHFGNESRRDYIWHSIVALGENTPPDAPWLPTDPITDVECSTAAKPGMGYQALSNLTGGLKFPVCEGFMFDAVFETIAEGVVDGTTVSCDFDIPDAPPGEMLDLNTVEVSYTSGASGAVEVFRQKADLTACDDGSFTIEGDRIELCPDTCAIVQTDPGASIEVLFGCALPYPI